MRVHVLLNPESGSGRAGRRWRRLEPLARRLFPDLEVHRSTGPATLTTIAARLAPLGGLVLAAGGDGTSHEVINGLAAAGERGQAVMGWLPLGSGNDLARGVGVPRNPVAALEHYARWGIGTASAIDLGVVEYRNELGEPTRRYFGNSFSIGVSAGVLEIVARLGKPLGGAASYFLATVAALARHRPATVSIDGVPGRYRLVSVTNGTTIGAGMRITPHAHLDDGRLDLLTIDAISRLATARLLPTVYWGGHLGRPAVQFRRFERLVLEPDGPVACEIDGELLRGVGPFTVEVRPRALEVARFDGRRLNSGP